MEEDNMNNKKELSSLDVKRKSLEMEAEAIVSELTSPIISEDGKQKNCMGIDTPLIDADGYPRSDIDVFRARTLRSRLAVIRTDHSNIMKKIETLLVLVTQNTNNRTTISKKEDEEEVKARRAEKPKPKFDTQTGKWVVMNWDGSIAGVQGGDKRSFYNNTATTVANDNTNKSTNAEQQDNDETVMAGAFQNLSTTTNSVVDSSKRIPFARVNSVAPNSPSSLVLEKDDLILQFGTVTKTDPTISGNNLLPEIGTLVVQAAASNDSIEIHLLRQQQTNIVSLTPQPWHGRGLLGCHIVNYEE